MFLPPDDICFVPGKIGLEMKCSWCFRSLVEATPSQGVLVVGICECVQYQDPQCHETELKEFK